jgi:hypothetical protein
MAADIEMDVYVTYRPSSDEAYPALVLSGDPTDPSSLLTLQYTGPQGLNHVVTDVPHGDPLIGPYWTN